eukprot:CAMPEP_0116011276 /NCGR_PEP_ID=MMETSP0321-20121206/4479_1 /TAXON_ID=163516 /ORGANISM="Leptocylindrus danicus var. danicus, Strain B650" /LENGTH=291 /DNA_ID=CAMNT_0003480493 /DNA_START=72 /DNA_END=947 /DNA_ORIENTATION=+
MRFFWAGLLINYAFAIIVSPSSESSQISAINLSKSYPVTILDKLFSSVPKREFAINSVNLELCNELVLLVGSSASGKSTLMKLILGQETGTGDIFINGARYDCSSMENRMIMKPIMVDRKSLYDDSKTVRGWIKHLLGQEFKVSTSTIDGSEALIDERKISMALISELCDLLAIDQEILDGKPSKLSPSDQYLLTLLISCAKNMIPHIVAQTENSEQPCGQYTYSCPILLLDELFDFEHSSIAQRVGAGLKNLVAKGGIVIVATHKPHQLESLANRKITLAGGKILTNVEI